jgi:hypothetical protein
MGAPVMVSTVAGAELLALRGALAACRTRAIASSGHLSTVLRQFTVSRGPERPEARAGLISRLPHSTAHVASVFCFA